MSELLVRTQILANQAIIIICYFSNKNETMLPLSIWDISDWLRSVAAVMPYTVHQYLYWHMHSCIVNWGLPAD